MSRGKEARTVKTETAAQTEAMALADDTARLDWLVSESADVRWHSDGDDGILLEIVGHWQAEPRERLLAINSVENLRAAIDEAMKGETLTQPPIAATLRQPASVEAEPVAWRPIDEWDQRDELVFLLVDYRGDDSGGNIEDAQIGFTIGHNTDHNVGEGEGQGWQFAGWSWCHDEYIQGRGKPVAWRPIPKDWLGEQVDRIDAHLADRVQS